MFDDAPRHEAFFKVVVGDLRHYTHNPVPAIGCYRGDVTPVIRSAHHLMAAHWAGSRDRQCLSKRGVILSLVALLGCSSAQERFDAPYGVLQRVKVSEATSERLLVRRIEPTYPRAAQQKCLQGNVVLSVIVAEDG